MMYQFFGGQVVSNQASSPPSHVTSTGARNAPLWQLPAWPDMTASLYPTTLLLDIKPSVRMRLGWPCSTSVLIDCPVFYSISIRPSQLSATPAPTRILRLQALPDATSPSRKGHRHHPDAPVPDSSASIALPSAEALPPCSALPRARPLRRPSLLIVIHARLTPAARHFPSHLATLRLTRCLPAPTPAIRDLALRGVSPRSER